MQSIVSSRIVFAALVAATLTIAFAGDAAVRGPGRPLPQVQARPCALVYTTPAPTSACVGCQPTYQSYVSAKGTCPGRKQCVVQGETVGGPYHLPASWTALGAGPVNTLPPQGPPGALPQQGYSAFRPWCQLP